MSLVIAVKNDLCGGPIKAAVQQWGKVDSKLVSVIGDLTTPVNMSSVGIGAMISSVLGRITDAQSLLNTLLNIPENLSQIQELQQLIELLQSILSNLQSALATLGSGGVPSAADIVTGSPWFNINGRPVTRTGDMNSYGDKAIGTPTWFKIP